jgi:hypothetical protein
MAAMAEEAALNFEDAIELGNFRVNLFPFRKQLSCTLKSFVFILPRELTVRHLPTWFPFAGFKRTVAHWREHLGLAISSPFDRVKSDMVSVMIS